MNPSGTVYRSQHGVFAYIHTHNAHAHAGQVQTDSSLSEPGEPRLRIALSCRRTHCIRTPSNRGSKVSKIRLLLVFVCTLSAYLIGLPHVIASLDQPEQRTQLALFNN